MPLCNRVLHDYRGGMSSGLWRTSRTLRAANGTRDSRSIEHGWSRNVLIHQIESNLYERQGKALTNFSRTPFQPFSPNWPNNLPDQQHNKTKSNAPNKLGSNK